ncbi:MAG: sensor histidine kinase, partial [Lachnospiraceae bacterium]|nr:sensor histidine kinase [Lachnospiraceae bacterium]
IENSTLNGIFEKPSNSGCLNIKVRRHGDGIRITVEDDGIGMDQTTLVRNFSRMTNTEHATVSSGYGIRNIQERLTLAYGPPYGLSCESIPGVGTTVTVFIPAIIPEKDQEE